VLPHYVFKQLSETHLILFNFLGRPCLPPSGGDNALIPIVSVGDAIGAANCVILETGCYATVELYDLCQTVHVFLP